MQTRIGNITQHAIPHRAPTPPFRPEPIFILEQVGNVFGFLADVGADVFPVFGCVDEFFQGSVWLVVEWGKGRDGMGWAYLTM